MTTLSGQSYSGFGTANLGGGLLFMSALGQQMSMVHGGIGGQVNRMALAQACDVASDGTCDGEPPGRWSLWGTAMGGMSTVAGNGSVASLDERKRLLEFPYVNADHVSIAKAR